MCNKYSLLEYNQGPYFHRQLVKSSFVFVWTTVLADRGFFFIILNIFQINYSTYLNENIHVSTDCLFISVTLYSDRNNTFLSGDVLSEVKIPPWVFERLFSVLNAFNSTNIGKLPNPPSCPGRLFLPKQIIAGRSRSHVKPSGTSALYCCRQKAAGND